MKLSSRLVALALLSGLLIPAATRAADVSFEQRLPDGIAFFMSIPDFADFKERFAETAYGRLIDDEQVAEFRSQVEKMIRESAAEEDVLPPGIDLDELLEIPSGEVAVAMTIPGRKAASFAMSLDFGESFDTVEKLIDKAVAASVEQGWTEGEVDFQGSRITTLEGPAIPNRPNQKPVKVVFVVEESSLVVSSSLDLCQEILDRWDGKSDGSLADNKVFRHVIDSTTARDRPPVLRWYVNVADLIKGAFDSADPTNMVLNVARGNIGRIGILELRGVGGSADFATDDGYDSITRTAAWVDEPVTGVLSVFTFPVDELTPPAWVPADTLMYLGMNWDLERAYTSVESLWDTIMGAGSFGAGVQKLATEENGPKIHIKLDVIDLLDGKIHFMQSSLGDAEDDPASAALMALEVKDAAKAIQLFEKIAALPGAPFEERTYRGAKIWSAKDAVGAPSFAVAHDCLILATDTDALEAMIRADPDVETLAESDRFKHHTSRMPDRVSMIALQQSEQFMRLIYDQLRNQPAGEDEPDPSTLPEFDVLKHYFLPTITYVVPNARGFEYVSYTLAEDVDE